MSFIVHKKRTRLEGLRGQRFIAVIVGFFAVAVATAQEPVPWYEIEIIVFANRGSEWTQAEAWRQPMPVRLADGVRELRPADTRRSILAAEPFLELRSDELRLHGARNRLQSSQRYQPLLHLGWRQPVRDRAGAIPVRIHTGARMHTGANTESDEQIALETVDGTLRVGVGRYLHVDADLLYRPSVPASSLPAVRGTPPSTPPSAAVTSAEVVQTQPVTAFRLQESRRMRSKELHYLDHPAFGLLIEITPYAPALTPPPPG